MWHIPINVHILKRLDYYEQKQCIGICVTPICYNMNDEGQVAL